MAGGPVVTFSAKGARTDVGTTEGPVVRYVLTAVALVFLLLFIVLPAVNVFAQALKKGVGAYTAVLKPSVDQARVEEIQQKLKPGGGASFVERRKLSKELSEINAPVEQARKNWSAVRLTLMVAAFVVPLNLVFGVAAAWAVTKFRFKGRAFLVSIIDLPFSVSPVVSGLIFVLLFGMQGTLENWHDRRTYPAMILLVILPAALAGAFFLLSLSRRLAAVAHRLTRGAARSHDNQVPDRLRLRCLLAVAGALLIAALALTVNPPAWSWAWIAPSGWQWPELTSLYWRGFAGGHLWPVGAGSWAAGVIFTPLAIVLASIFVTFPFVARSLIPLMESQGSDEEMAAISLGAGGWRTFRLVTLPNIKWGILYGVILCTARAFGEFGAVSVVSGHVDANDTMPLRVEKLWNEYNTQAAFTVATLLASLAVLTLIAKAIVEWKTRQEMGDAAAAVPDAGGAR